jgi:sulfur-oxidizing protein SoxY
MEATERAQLTRRALLTVAVAGGAAIAGLARPALADDEAVALIKQVTGGIATESDRVRLTMPPVFPNGYTVPLAFQVDTAMTQSDHVKKVIVLAPLNPIVEVAVFHFIAQRSEPRISTRIRLAKPQYVFAVAEMNDGALLMAKTWVEVTTNGCS